MYAWRFWGGVVLGLCCVWFVEKEYEREREDI